MLSTFTLEPVRAQHGWQVNADSRLKTMATTGTSAYTWTGKQIRDSRWHHVVVTYGINDNKIYIDGAMASCSTGLTEGSMPGVLQPGEGAALAAGAFNKLRLGLGFSASNTNRVIGQMQDLRLWRATLSYYQVLAVYSDVSADFPSDHWHYPMHGTLEAALSDCEACGAAHCARGTCADFTVRSSVLSMTAE